RNVPARDEAPSSPITRTVVRVLEVIPPGVRMALAALALLGLLLGAAAIVQTVRGRRLARQRRMLLDDVGILQSALLPALPKVSGGARVTAAYRPAAGLAAGGDFYDAFDLPGGRTAVIVGDVAGHGRDAVPLTALVRYNLRAYLEAGLAPRATLDAASHVLAPQLGARQVTIVVAIFDPGTGRLTYACAGHAPPLLPDSDAVPVTVSSSPPVGAGVPTGRRQTTVGLAPGQRACFHTDGLGEVPVGGGDRLGRDGVASELEAIGPRATATALIERIVRRSDGQPDDMAVCILTAGPGGSEHWSLRIEELEVDAAMLRSGAAERFLVACGVSSAHIARALREARQMVGLAGTALVEVRVGEELVEVRVDAPPAVMLPIARRPTWSFELAETA
ncbi:MAG TPA: PP2C family protein-serine/threonine phosphatase, partial [Solirubrobacteraceae bacterium]|nr:PP2C family protein-serine/threonine phosphatase [Solirubrobacteraceae bacterium]